MAPRSRLAAAAALLLLLLSTAAALPSWPWSGAGGRGALHDAGAAADAAPPRRAAAAPAPWAPPPLEGACFEEDCRSSPFIMHASRSANVSGGGRASCFKFVAIGCYAAPKGCCPAVARRFSALEFDASAPAPRAAPRACCAACARGSGRHGARAGAGRRSRARGGKPYRGGTWAHPRRAAPSTHPPPPTQTPSARAQSRASPSTGAPTMPTSL